AEAAVLNAETLRITANLVSDPACEPLPEVTRDRRHLQPSENLAVHSKGAREYEQVDVVSHVGVVLKRLRKHELDAALLAGPADVADELEHGAHSLLLVRHCGGDRLRNSHAARGQTFPPAHEPPVGTRDV